MNGWSITSEFNRVAAIPAQYTPEDPYDLAGKQPLFESLQTDWYNRPPEQQAQAIANAFRSTMISPQLELKWNAVAYQALMDVPASESNPQAYEDYLRNWKRRYDNPGQTNLLDPESEGFNPEEVLPGSRMNPPFWKNVRGLSVLAPYIEELREAALEDVATGGKGFHFRDVAMRIPGIGPKIASFAWLILMPSTSELAAIDLWMMRHLGEKGESPNDSQYFVLEDRLRKERDELYPGVPLGQFQWAVWDSLRTPGEHQDHSPFRVIDPPNFRDVEWSGPGAVDRAQQQRFKPKPVNPLQMNLMSNTKSGWNFFKRNPKPELEQPPIDEPEVESIPTKPIVNQLSEKQTPSIPLDGIPWIIHNGQVWIQDGGMHITMAHELANQGIASIEELARDKQGRLMPGPEIINYKENFNPLTPEEWAALKQAFAPYLDNKTSNWSIIRLAASYSIQGKIVAGVPGLAAEGVAIRPDKQDRQTIEAILDNLYTHQEDALRQRKEIPEWALNRGGKVESLRKQLDHLWQQRLKQSDFAPGPGGQGFTYGAGAIVVSKWIDVNDNWLLYDPRVVGLIAELGGAASHGVVVARERKIPIIVDTPEASRIQPGDQLTIDSTNAIINVNGGSVDQFDQAQEADIPVVAWVWSQGEGLTSPITSANAGQAAHKPMMMQMYRAGQWDRKDNAMGIIYEDGHWAMLGNPSDQEELRQWLNTIHPIVGEPEGFDL